MNAPVASTNLHEIIALNEMILNATDLNRLKMMYEKYGNYPDK